MKINWNVLAFGRPRLVMSCSLWHALQTANGGSRHLIIKQNRVSLPSSGPNICSVTALSFIPSVCHSGVQLVPRQHVTLPPLPSALYSSSKTCYHLSHAKKCTECAWQAPKGASWSFFLFFLKSNQGSNIVMLSHLQILGCVFHVTRVHLRSRDGVSCFYNLVSKFSSCVWKVVHFNKCNVQTKMNLFL